MRPRAADHWWTGAGSLTVPAGSGRKHAPADLLDKALFLPAIWIACSLGVSLRLIGPLFIVAPVGMCLVYAVLRRTVPPRMLSAYFVYCIVIAILSSHRLMPTSWQTHFEPDAIVRQLVPTLGFVSVAWASKAYFARRFAAGEPFHGARVFLILSLFVAPMVMFLNDRQYQGQSVEASVLALYGALINNVIIAMLFLTRSVFLQKGGRRYAALAVIVLIGATTHFIQFRIFLLALLAILATGRERLVMLIVAVVLVGAYAVGMNYVAEAMREAPNSGLRLALVADAIRSVIDTNGVGVGYGLESVRWRYVYPGMPVFTFLPDANTMTHERLLSALSTGVENSFVQAMLRTGVLGFALFAGAFLVLVPPRRLPRGLRNHGALVLIMVGISCFVNSSLESPLAVVGVGFSYGYLIALRRAASAFPAPVSRRAPMFMAMNAKERRTECSPLAEHLPSQPPAPA